MARTSYIRVSAVLLGVFAAAQSLAAPLIVSGGQPRTGPAAQRTLMCVQAIQQSGNFGHGLALSPRVTTHRNADGSIALVFSGTTWRDGARVPVTARCALQGDGQVASVTRIDTASVADR